MAAPGRRITAAHRAAASRASSPTVRSGRSAVASEGGGVRYGSFSPTPNRPNGSAASGGSQ